MYDRQAVDVASLTCRLSLLVLTEVPSAVDDDVAREEARVDGEVGDAASDVVVASHLRKVFDDKPKAKVAVRDFTLGCRVGECFGLLGPNGASACRARIRHHLADRRWRLVVDSVRGVDSRLSLLCRGGTDDVVVSSRSTLKRFYRSCRDRERSSARGCARLV